MIKDKNNALAVKYINFPKVFIRSWSKVSHQRQVAKEVNH